MIIQRYVVDSEHHGVDQDGKGNLVYYKDHLKVVDDLKTKIKKLEAEWVYTVIKMGVYRHDIPGVFSSLEEAERVAGFCIRAEPDNYHTFIILRFELNKPTTDGVLVCTLERLSKSVIQKTRRVSC